VLPAAIGLRAPGRAATMNSVPDNRRVTARKAGRHLSAVPDDQPAMWDPVELKRLDQLRQIAVDTEVPAAALHIIETAASADEAVAALVSAGLMPTENESAESMLTWFAPLLEPGCDQLEAELCAAAFIGALRRSAPDEDAVPDLLEQLVDDLAGNDRPEAMAMAQALSVIGPAQSRAAAMQNAAARLAGGQDGQPWAAGLGAPVPGRAFGYTDIYGEQRSMVVTFGYGRQRHAVVVLIDYVLGGGIKDCYVTDYTEAIRTEYRRLGRDPDLQFADLDLVQACALLAVALSKPPCPADPDQAEGVEDFLELIRARVDLLAANIGAPGPATGAGAGQADSGKRGTAKRTPARRNVHRIKVTLRGTKPAIWRRFEVPSDISLKRLHEVIQAGFGWQNYHLFAFDTAVGRYGIPGPDSDDRNAATKKLSAVADWPGDKLRYEYDFGDGWEHDIVVEAVAPAEPGTRYSRCTGGKRAGPPEDCGGIPGYASLIKIMASPRHEEHQERLDWLGLTSAAEFDPEHFDVAEVNARLVSLARVLVRP
jgi:hypothetical protein